MDGRARPQVVLRIETGRSRIPDDQIESLIHEPARPLLKSSIELEYMLEADLSSFSRLVIAPDKTLDELVSSGL